MDFFRFLRHENFGQNANQINDQQQNRHVVEIPVLGLIYNITRLNNEFLENVNANEYYTFVFLQQNSGGSYVYTKSEKIIFDPEKESTTAEKRARQALSLRWYFLFYSYSTVTLLARFLGLSTSRPLATLI